MRTEIKTQSAQLLVGADLKSAVPLDDGDLYDMVELAVCIKERLGKLWLIPGNNPVLEYDAIRDLATLWRIKRPD